VREMVQMSKKQMVVWLPEDLKNNILEISKDTDKSMRQLVQEAMEEMVRNHKEPIPLLRVKHTEYRDRV
jgi:predicted DNA-binding protein